MTDADKKAKRRKIIKGYEQAIRRRGLAKSRAIHFAKQEYNEKVQLLQAARKRALEALTMEAGR